MAVAGGLRFTNRTSAKRWFYVGARAGIEHDEFETAFAIYPGGGAMLPLNGKKYFVVVGIDYDVVFYEGYTSKGPSFHGGISIPLGAS